MSITEEILGKDEFIEEAKVEKQEIVVEKPVEQKEEKPVEEKPTTVPLAVFLEEKSQRRHFQQLLEGQAEQLNALREKLDNFTAKPVEVPEKDDDPIGFLAHQTTDTKASIDALKAQIAELSESQKVEQFRSALVKMETDFATSKTDYWQAVEFLKSARRQECEEIGYSEKEIQNAISSDYSKLVQSAVANGKNPAEIAYKLAVSRGFSAKDAKTEVTPGGIKATNESLKKLAQKQLASKSLSGTSSKLQKDDLTTEAAVMADDSEFDALLVGRKNEKNWERLARG